MIRPERCTEGFNCKAIVWLLIWFSSPICTPGFGWTKTSTVFEPDDCRRTLAIGLLVFKTGPLTEDANLALLMLIRNKPEALSQPPVADKVRSRSDSVRVSHSTINLLRLTLPKTYLLISDEFLTTDDQVKLLTPLYLHIQESQILVHLFVFCLHKHQT